MTGLEHVHFAGWCSSHHLVEAVTSADIWDGSSYIQTCGTCGRPTRLGDVPANRVGQPVHEYAVFHPLPDSLVAVPVTGALGFGPCISRGYLTASQALQHAEPGQLVAIMCSDDSEHDMPMAACGDCREKHPAAASTVIVNPGVTKICIEFTKPGSDQ
ncbi:MAG TPA: hypothetical protein VE476_00140 [Propionibacteriaceae bacterium]|nr:hypothetical protein [Propionibacteriaceae bacterium]